MKKKVLMIFLLVSTILAASCGELEYIDPADSTEPIKEEISHLWVPLAEGVESSSYATTFDTDTTVIETEKLLIHCDGSSIHYIDKSTGESFPLCTDPVCSHTFFIEGCPASSARVNGMCYSPETKTVYIARCADPTVGHEEFVYEIVAVYIGDMSFDYEILYSTSPGNEILSLIYDSANIYFSMYTYDEENDEESILYKRLNESDRKITDCAEYPTYGVTFYAQNNELYIHEHTSQLLRYNKDTEEWDVIITPGGDSVYVIAEDKIYSAETDGIYSYSFDGENKTQLWKSDTEGYHQMLTVSPDGVIYYHGYDHSVTSDGTKNGSSGKLYRIKDEITEVYYDFGSTDCLLSKIAFIGGAVFTRYDYRIDLSTDRNYCIIGEDSGTVVRCDIE